MEHILDKSGAQIRHLRCGWVMENFLEQAHQIREHGLLSYPMAGHIAVPMTAANDVADVALKWLVRRDWLGTRRVPVYGHQALSFDQSSAIFERVLGKPVRYREISVDDYVRHLVRSGASVYHARSLVAMFAALAQGITCPEAHTADSATPTTLSAWTISELFSAETTAAPPPEQDAASVDFLRPQPAISAVPHGQFLACFSVARPRMNELPRYDLRRSMPPTKGMVRPCRHTVSERWVGEGI
jgi:hypothetical protein